jgi:hypothetical protein
MNMSKREYIFNLTDDQSNEHPTFEFTRKFKLLPKFKRVKRQSVTSGNSLSR